MRLIRKNMRNSAKLDVRFATTLILGIWPLLSVVMCFAISVLTPFLTVILHLNNTVLLAYQIPDSVRLSKINPWIYLTTI